ncbi:MAG: sugar ABC transporter substrate-binding protein [Lachnospiraceae bacterium]|nr:sugar ABC transporter substrate-binding protein [Lachnospiraceae bacterium]
MKKRLAAGLIVAMILAWGGAGCGKSDSQKETKAPETKKETQEQKQEEQPTKAAETKEAKGEEASGETGKKLKIGLTLSFYNDPYFIDMRNVVKDWCDENGYEFLEFDGASDAAKQAAGIENMMEAGIDGLILAPVDSAAVVPQVQKCNEAGIPVITVDCNADGGEIVSFIESDNRSAGILCAEYLGERLEGKGNICITNAPNSSAARDRDEGFREVLAEKYPDIKILDTQKSGDMPTGMNIGENWASQYADLDAVFCIDDNSALGVQAAFEAAGRTDIFTVSVDGSEQPVKDILDGRLVAATAAQQPKQIGALACEALLDHISGKEVEEHIQIPVILVTKDNAQDYLDGKLTQ